MCVGAGARWARQGCCTCVYLFIRHVPNSPPPTLGFGGPGQSTRSGLRLAPGTSTARQLAPLISFSRSPWLRASRNNTQVKQTKTTVSQKYLRIQYI